MVSQNNEAQIVIDYFNGYIGNLLDIGANDGKTFSNSYDLIGIDWSAVLVEPVRECFSALCKLHDQNKAVSIINCGLGENTEIREMHVPNDSLLATVNPVLIAKWGITKDITTIPTPFYSVKDFLSFLPVKKFDFISIDAEGCDWEILQQMNLTELECKCICVEYGMHLSDIINHCAQHGLTKRLLKNGENIIIAK